MTRSIRLDVKHRSCLLSRGRAFFVGVSAGHQNQTKVEGPFEGRLVWSITKGGGGRDLPASILLHCPGAGLSGYLAPFPDLVAGRA